MSHPLTITRTRRIAGLPAVVALGLSLAAACLFSGAAHAQFRPPTDTLHVGGEIGGPRSLPEQGYMHPFLNLNRAFLGTRAMGMGGAGLALEGTVNSIALNPAGLSAIREWTLTSEYRFVSGSGSVSSFPARLEVGPDAVLEASGYRVDPRILSTYYNMSLGLPLVLLGRPGALGITYRRLSAGFQGEETRFELVGPVTNNLPATTGVGQSPDGGQDAFTVTVASDAASWLDLGANLNLQSGTISNRIDIGAATFGQIQTGGGTRYEQDVSGFNVDVGAQLDLGSLHLAGTVFLGYDLKFENGRATTFPLPDIQLGPDAPVYRVEEVLLDHRQSVPTALGAGIAYDLKENFVIAADFWYQPWSESEYTRQRIDDVNMFFIDPTDSSTFFYQLQFGEGDESFSAELEDNASIRVGMEYVFRHDRPVRIPVRVGFRRETLPVNNISVRAPYDDFTELLNEYWRYVCDQPGCPGLDPSAVNTDQIVRDLKRVLEYNNMVFQGDAIDATTFSLGLDVELESLAFQLAAQRTSYDIDRFFFQAFNPDLSPVATITQESRSLTAVSLAATVKF